MATEEMFTSLPTVSSATMSDIICAVQGYLNPSNLGISVQETLGQVFNLFQSNIVLFYDGDPNGNVAGTTYQFCWDAINNTLYICVLSGPASTAVWVRADINDGYTTTVTGGTTTTLSILSTYWQFFTGTMTQTVIMPVTSTLAAGMSWTIVNDSTQNVTIQSSGLNTIITLAPSTQSTLTCILNSGSTETSWYASVTSASGGVTSITGTAHQVLANGTTGTPETGVVTLTLPQNIDATASPTFNNLTLTGGNIYDVNSNIVLLLTAFASAVNYIDVRNSAAAGAPVISSQGSDTNIGLSIGSKGDAGIGLHTAAVSAFPLIFYSGTAQQHVTNFAFPNTSNMQTVTFPDASGTVAFTNQLFVWNNVAGTSQAAAVNNGYIIGNAAQTTVTLPATAAVGSVVAIAGQGAGGFILQANGGQTIKVAASTTSSGGSLTSAEQYDAVEVVCVVANTTWVARSAVTTGFVIA